MTTRGDSFLEKYNQLVEGDYPEAEDKTAIELIMESDSEMLGRYDDIKAEITWSIDELTREKAEKREGERERERIADERETAREAA